MKADLLMAIHFHQPVGNFDHVIEGICDRCYLPFISLLNEYPDIRMSFHLTGCLLEWLEAKRPEILIIIKNMVDRGQIEMIAGGFYEPILPSIPERDRVAQIKMLKEYLNKRFGSDPKGAWIAERVWEPGLPSTLLDAGIKYVILDDTHFLYSGVKKDRTYGHYITEDNGKTVAVFPSDKVLRYHLPFKLPHEAIEYIKHVSGYIENPTFIYGDDGEKFGEWPGTHKWVYEDGWLRKFFDELQKNSSWLRTTTFSECLEEKAPLGRIYLGTSSYEEMLEWALPASSQEEFENIHEEIRNAGKEDYYKPYFKGGFWRNFLTKYPESNNMNKKMLYVSAKIDAARGKHSGDAGFREAERDLYRGQCNCAYWHGVFGGLYLFHLRRALYHHIIKAETLLDKVLHGSKDMLEATEVDFDGDSLNEAVIENREMSICVDPAEGGVIKEIDVKGEVCQNLMNGLTRRKEAYHRTILRKIEEKEKKEHGECKTIHDAIQVADAGIKNYLIYDTNLRHSLIDRFFDESLGLEDFSRNNYSELGGFAGGVYTMTLKKSAKSVAVSMARVSEVKGTAVSITKKITFPRTGAEFSVEYSIKNKGQKQLEANFGIEMNISMPNADSSQYVLSLSSKGNQVGLKEKLAIDKVKDLRIIDNEKKCSVELGFSTICSIWHFPVETVSQSEVSYERNYQGSMIMPFWMLKLKAGEEKKVTIDLKIQ
ncbi:MAG: DUF1926 domain-containing protein [Candidatus Omnitrophica bacterium]|nr:DUF1926 domain-containing protein [Candidatus Omnitrophota bacterium]